MFRGAAPVLFMHTEGQEERLEDSPSWYNMEEVSVVVDLVQSLTKHDSYPVTPADIGIIAPYRKQVVKIKEALKHWNLREVTVGTVEALQGQERRVVIVTTVRSRQEQHLQSDSKFKIGFVSN